MQILHPHETQEPTRCSQCEHLFPPRKWFYGTRCCDCCHGEPMAPTGLIVTSAKV